jgi:hypothetical protein
MLLHNSVINIIAIAHKGNNQYGIFIIFGFLYSQVLLKNVISIASVIILHNAINIYNIANL